MWENEDAISVAVQRGQELLGKSVAEATKAFEEAYVLLYLYVDEIAAYCVAKLDPHFDLARETTQEIFLGIWKGLPTFRFESTWRTWVYGIAYRCVSSRLRTLSRDRRTFQEIRETEQGQQIAPLENVADIRPDPELSYGQQEQRRWYEYALLQLETDERAILMMYYGYEDSMQKIANVLGISLATAYRHKHQAERKCHDILKRMEEETTSESA